MSLVEKPHDGLDDSHQRLIPRLAAFVGGFTAEAAEVMSLSELPETPGSNVWEVSTNRTPPGRPSSRLIETLQFLVLIDVLQREDGLDGVPRYELNKAVRKEIMDEPSAEFERARRIHAHYFLAFAEAADARVFGVESPYLLGRMAADAQNIRAALSWSEETGETVLGL